MDKTYKYGMYIAATLIGYFLIIDLLGFAEVVWLSFFNAIITGGCIFLAVRDVYKNRKDDFEYMAGFSAGLTSGLIGTTIFTIFMAVYLYEVRPELATSLQEQITIAGSGIEVAILLFIFLSGLATTVTSALVILPIYKQSWNTKQVRKKQDPLHDKH